MKKLSIILIVAILFLILPLVVKPAKATVYCDTQYGEVCREIELLIDKMVWDPVNGKFVDNLGINDYKFAPDEEITFRLEVKNVGDETFAKIDVRDYLPNYLEHISGDIDFEIKDLEPDETEVREFKARVVSADKFPSDESIICVVNRAEAWNGDEKDEDTTQVCMEKKVLGVTELPPTGPENWLLILPFSLLAGLVGLYLRKFSI
ncbi:DUF11 domain-containing protein [Patescibacteria group bacterium]|nr:DUF11 domain-containing protein [Patescibacteria group bacterium]